MATLPSHRSNENMVTPLRALCSIPSYPVPAYVVLNGHAVALAQSYRSPLFFSCRRFRTVKANEEPRVALGQVAATGGKHRGAQVHNQGIRRWLCFHQQ
jgi:hypothetical protein